MKVCIKENEFNPSLLSQDWCTEEKAVSMGYSVYDVPTGCEDCAFEDFDGNGFNVDKYNQRKQNEQTRIANADKIAELKQKLSDMDYKGQKYLDGDYTEEEWEAIKAERKAIRKQIRELEVSSQE